MPVDASIPLRVNPVQLPDQMNALARALQLRGAMADQDMQALKADEYRRGVDSGNRLRDILSGGGDASALRKGGFLKEANDWEKSSADTDKIKAETGSKRIETVTKRVGLYRDTMANVNDQQGALQLITAMHADPELQGTPVTAVPLQQQLQELQRVPFQQWKQEFGLGATKFIELNAPKTQTVNTGGSVQVLQTPGLGGAPSVVSSMQVTQSPDNAASVGASYANAQATRDAAKATADATREAAGIKDRRDTELKLADDWRAQSKGYKEVEDAAARVKSALATATKSAPATLAAATSFMKMLDPNSVVRESELVMALQASGALDRAMNYFNILQRGKVLTTQQAEEFGKVTDTLLRAAREQQGKVDDSYRQTAQRNNLRPEMVIQNLGQTAPAPGGSGLTPEAEAVYRKYGGR
jgi:hypothetical protein